MSDHKSKENGAVFASSLFSEKATQDFTERTRQVFQDADALKKFAEQWKNQDPAKSQGFLYEQLEVTSFNFQALKQDSDLVAKTTSEMGYPTDPADILIKKGKETVREVQAKSSEKPSASLFYQAKDKYQGMGRLSPKDKWGRMQELGEERIESGTLKSKDYQDVLDNRMDGLKHEEIETQGTTYGEAIQATDPEKAQEIGKLYKVKSGLIDMHKSGLRGAAIGGALSGTVSTASNFYDYKEGNKEIGEVIAGVGVDAAKGAATAYTVTALSKGVQHGAPKMVGEAAGAALTKSNAPAAIASGVVQSGKSIVSYLKGDIESDEMLNEISQTAIIGTSTFYYGAVGQTAIPVPVVGAMVGAGVGYFVGHMLHQSSLVALGEPEAVRAARERREQVEAICLAAIEQMQANRRELEKQLDEYFADRKEDFLQSFQLMDEAMGEWDPNRFVQGLQKINYQFGASLQFENREEFDSFMKSDEPFKL